MNKRILLLGGSGFLGRNLIEAIVDKQQLNHYELYAPRHLMCDLTNAKQVQEIIYSFKPTHIVHLAAKASVRTDNPVDILNNNINSTYNLLEYCPQNTDFIFASSILVYGNDEGGFQENDKLKPSSIYGISKVVCENLINLYYTKGKVRPRILRLCGSIGKHLSHGRIYEALSGVTDFKLYGNPPGDSQPYLYVGDTVQAIIAAIQSNRPNVLCNICPNDYISLEAMFKLLENKMNKKINLVWTNGQKDCMMHYYNEQAAYQLNWSPKYNSMEAIKTGLEEILG